MDAIVKVNGARFTAVIYKQSNFMQNVIKADTEVLKNANPSSKMTADSVQSPATVMKKGNAT